MAYFDVEESFYFEQKLAQLKALDPALYGNWEVAQVQAAFAEAGLSAQEHFDQYGWAEELSANATFDVAKYLAAKAAQLNDAAYEGKTDWTSADVVAAFQAAGLSAEAHFTQYGEAEGLEAQPVEGAPSTLTEALAQLKSAQDAEAAYLKEVEVDVEFVDGATTTTIDKETADKAAVTGYLDAAITSINTVGTITLDKTKTDAYNDALIDQKKLDLEKDVATALKEAQKVEGLEDAAEAVLTAQDALKAAIKVTSEAKLAASMQVAAADAAGSATVSLVAHNGTTVNYTDLADKTVLVKGDSAEEYVVVDSKGNIVLGKNAKDLPNKAELLATVQEYIAAYNAQASAVEGLNSAVASVIYAEGNDTVGDGSAALSAVAIEDTAETATLTGSPNKGLYLLNDVLYVKDAADTYFQVLSYEVKVAKADGALTIAEVTIDSTAKEQGIDDAAVTGKELKELEFNASDLDASEFFVAATGALDNAFGGANGSKKAGDYIKAKADLADFVEAITQYRDAKALADEYKEYADAVEAASKFITDAEKDGGLGITLLKSTETAFTTKDDVYLLDSNSDGKTLTKFNLNGEDKIFIGEGYTLVGLGDDKITDNVGSASALEVFFEQIGNNAKIYVETEAFGGNSSGTQEIIEVQLNGVTAADLTLEDGFLFIA